MKINSQKNRRDLKMKNSKKNEKNSTWVMYLTLSCALSTLTIVMKNPLYAVGAIFFGICAILTTLKKNHK